MAVECPLARCGAKTLSVEKLLFLNNSMITTANVVPRNSMGSTFLGRNGLKRVLQNLQRQASPTHLALGASCSEGELLEVQT